jgi:hypothetical protein
MWMKTALFSLVVALAASAQDNKDKDAEKAKEEEAKKKIEDFRKEIKKAPKPGDKCFAIQQLGQTQHPKIADELKSLLRDPSADVCAAAAEQLSKYAKDTKIAETLLGVAKGRAAAAGKDKEMKEGAVKCIRYAGDMNCKDIVGKLVDFFKDKETDVAREAVDSCGKLKAKAAIDPLISLAREMEAIRDNQGQPGDVGLPGGVSLPGGAAANQSQGEVQTQRKKAILPACWTALGQITGQNFSSVKEWTGWWSKNKATFKEQGAP